MRGGSQERECYAKFIKAGMEKNVLSLTLGIVLKFHRFVVSTDSVDLMAIDQMSYRF